MSTFNGIVKEFPNIRIDFFRKHPGRTPPAALFLSHVHSDHLMGLESVKMPFVYCSAVTRRILLKMEKYPHRINFAKGILEARKLHYRHLRTILRPLPLQTATELELAPKSTIRVTLLDANHCPGSVMFLIEGDGKAILYTGDVRSEPWWVNSMVQNPVVLPYTCGLKRLDCLYLDTTFASHDELYREFPTKAEGVVELLHKVARCPPDSVFYFRAWTLGYEKVWVALSNLLHSRIHVDEYQLRILRRSADHGPDLCHETPALTGFAVGNDWQPGCLTSDTNVRIHSCEPGTRCHAKMQKSKNVRWITPIISRLPDGTEVREVGAGGGRGDLYQTPEVHLDDVLSLQQLMDLCSKSAEGAGLVAKVQTAASRPATWHGLRIRLEHLNQDSEADITVQDLVRLLTAEDANLDTSNHQVVLAERKHRVDEGTDRTIHFPYSRHSSFSDLRRLVQVFRPKDVCPCTVDLESWSEEVSMEALFGDLCSEKTFHFDHETRTLADEYRRQRPTSQGKRKRADYDSQETETQEEEPAGEAYHTANSEICCVEGDESRPAALAPERSSPPAQRHEGPAGDDRRLHQIQAEFHTINEGRTYIVLDDDSDEEALSALQLPSTGEEFSSQRPDGASAAPGQTKTRSGLETTDGALSPAAILDAYRAAKLCLRGNDCSEWDDLSIRSVGNPGQELDELEL